MRLRAVPPSAKRDSEGLRKSEGSGAALDRSTAATPQCDLPWRAVPAGAQGLGLTSNRVFGLTKTDKEWSEQLEAALTAACRDDLKHGTTPAYVRGCVCSECREHQRKRMARSR
jgi:hypothetical protein